MDATLTRAGRLLKEELREASPSNEWLIARFEECGPTELAELFVTASFFRGVLQPLIDQDWLRQHRSDPSAHDLRPQQIENELASLSFLRAEITTATSKQLRTYFNRMVHLLHVVISFVQMEPSDRYRGFARHAMKLIDERAREIDRFAHSHFADAMVRAFDQMDEILGINYELDQEMANENRERVFEGAGAGVQTSYSSILLALDRVRPREGARVLDLGSGFGRVGFVLGLLRPDLDFTGYEFVDHRVRDCTAVASRAGLEKTSFATQDLSAFTIPSADVYYMYDPFNRETYETVLHQLIAHGRANEITIITKGRANSWVREALAGEKWTVDETCDSGTICVFRSLGMEHFAPEVG